MYKKKFLFAILVCILLSACKKGKEESAQKLTQTEIEREEKAENIVEEITSDENIEEDKTQTIVEDEEDENQTIVEEITTGENDLDDENQTLVLESSSDCAVPNKYFTSDDIFTAKGISETIKTIDEKHFLLYLQNLIKSKAYEKLAAYNPYKEKEISKETSEPIKFEDGYTFYPETIQLQVSDKDIMEMEKYSETTYKYDNDCVTEIKVDKDGLNWISKESKNRYFYKSRYSESAKNYEYDNQGNLITTTNEKGEKKSNFYDGNNNCIKEIFPDGTEVTYDYENGLCTCEHHPKYNIYMKYDNKKNIIEKFNQAYSSSWTNSEGMVITNYYPKHYEIFFYDDSSKKIAEWSYSLEEKSYEYDKDGNLRKYVSTYSGESFYDESDNQDYEDKRTIDTYSPEEYDEEYDENGNTIHYIIDGPGDTFQNWFMNDKHGNVVIQSRSWSTWSNRTDIKYFYEYDSNGNIIHKVTSSGGEEFFKYDENNQLKVHFSIWENLTGYSIRTFEDGKIINESSVTYNYIGYYAGDKIIMNEDTIYKYDEHGNMIYSLSDSGDLSVVYCKYEYDKSGRKILKQEYHNY